MKQQPASGRPEVNEVHIELERLSALAMSAGKDFNDELTLILNRAVISLDLIGEDHPAAADLVALQDSVLRCAEITRCLMLLTIRARDSVRCATLQ